MAPCHTCQSRTEVLQALAPQLLSIFKFSKAARGLRRAGHADYTYLVKYGTKASSGGGRSSVRALASAYARSAPPGLGLSLYSNTELRSLKATICKRTSKFP
eukprot:1508610-Pleurochrysis_carterae.AAC.1